MKSFYNNFPLKRLSRIINDEAISICPPKYNGSPQILLTLEWSIKLYLATAMSENINITAPIPNVGLLIETAVSIAIIVITEMAKQYTITG